MDHELDVARKRLHMALRAVQTWTDIDVQVLARRLDCPADVPVSVWSEYLLAQSDYTFLNWSVIDT